MAAHHQKVYFQSMQCGLILSSGYRQKGSRMGDCCSSVVHKKSSFFCFFFLVIFFFNPLKASFFLLHAHSVLPQGVASLKQLLHCAERFCKQEMFASLKQLFVGYICSGELELTCSCTTHPSEIAGELLPDNLLSVRWKSWSLFLETG